jgi:nucleotide-binding universal stress UspA family protein
MSVFKKILVPVDNSDLSDRVLDAAMSLATAGTEEVIVLRIVAEGASLHADQAVADLNVIEHEIASLEQRALAFQVPGSTSTVRAEVRAGAVVDTIVEAAADLMVDLILMGSHGRSGFAELLTGSSTEQVVQRAAASVLVVRPLGYPYLRD